MTQPGGVTMYDVASRAGVSPATVSRFLAGNGYVGQASRDKITRAIESLGYVPNRAAASLKSGRSGLIGFVASDLQNPFVAGLAASIDDRARTHGYGLVVADSRGDAARAVESIELLRGHAVDGVIITPPESRELNAALISLHELGVPVVGLGLHTQPAVIDVATVDTRRGARAAIDHLIGLGHRRIAMIGSRDQARGRRETYRVALRAAGLPVLRELQKFGPLNRAGGVAAGEALLTRPDPPTAIFAVNDSVALGVLQAASRLGISVPTDVSLVGFDDGELAEHASPPLTTVAQPRTELGRLAVQLLTERARAGQTLPARAVALPCSLVIRASTAPPPG